MTYIDPNATVPASDTIACPCCGAPMAGPPSVDSLLLAVGSGHTRTIIERLVDRYPKPVRMSELIDLLWGDDPNGGPDHPRNNVYANIWRLNQQLKSRNWRVVGEQGGAAFNVQVRLVNIDTKAAA